MSLLALYWAWWKFYLSSLALLVSLTTCCCLIARQARNREKRKRQEANRRERRLAEESASGTPFKLISASAKRGKGPKETRSDLVEAWKHGLRVGQKTAVKPQVQTLLLLLFLLLLLLLSWWCHRQPTSLPLNITRALTQVVARAPPAQVGRVVLVSSNRLNHPRQSWGNM